MEFEKTAITEELKALAVTLADWSCPATSAIVYVFGSRVRGDHRLDSDVDISIGFSDYSHEDVHWWTKINDDNFESINVRLPGRLEILEESDPITHRVRSAPVVYQYRNVRCVYLPPKEDATLGSKKKNC